MQKNSVVFELTNGEIRVFDFSVSSFWKPGHSSAKVKYDRIPIPTGIIEQGTVRDKNSLIDILLTYRSRNSGKYQKVYLAISLQQGFIQAYTLPWLPKRDRTSALSLLVDEEISIARSDLLYDYLVISEEKHKNLKVLLGAARRSLLEHYVFIFGQAGFTITEVDFGFSILGQALGFEAKEDALYLQGESGSLQLVLFRGIVPENIRTLSPWPAKNELGQLTLNLGSAEDEREISLSAQVEVWENEINRILLYYRTQYQDLNLKSLVWTGNYAAEKLARRLADSVQSLTVKQAGLRDIPDPWQKVIEDSPGCGEVAVGYALRILTRRPGLNLWRQPTSEQKVQRTYLRLAFLAVFLLIIQILIGVSLSHMAMPLQQEVNQLSSQGLKVDEQNNSQEALATAWNKVSVHSEEIGERLAEVYGLAETGLNIEQVVFKQDILSVRGSAIGSKSVQTTIRDLRFLGWEELALTSYKVTEPDNVEFALSAKYGRSRREETLLSLP